MAIGELARLERFRRAANALGLADAPTGLSSAQEIDHLRCRINAMLYPGFKEWMLPSWAILMLRDMKRELESEFLENTTYRNWSLIGGVGGNEYATADSRGLTIGRPECGAIDVWISRDETILFPALQGRDSAQLELVSTDDQIYQWKTDAESVEYTRLVYHVRRGDTEALYNEINLKNLNLEETSARFYVALRPMSHLGFEPLESIEYNESTNTVLANHGTALVFDHAPTSVMMVDADDMDLIRKVRSDPDRFDKELKNERGLGQCILRYDIILPPAGSMRIFFVSPFSQSDGAKVTTWSEPKSTDRDHHIASWFDFVHKRSSASFPDSTLDSVFSQSVASVTIQAYSAMFPKNSHFAAINWKDRMRILLSLVQTRCTDLVLRIVEDLVGSSGVSEDQIEPSVFSPILWGLLQIEEYGLVAELPLPLQGFIETAVKALVESAPSEIDDGVPEDDDSLLQHYSMIQPGVFQNLEDNLWNLAALRVTERIAKKWTDPGMPEALAESINAYQVCVESAIDGIETSRWPRPTDENMDAVDREILDLLVTYSQMDLDLKRDFFDSLCKKVQSRRIVKGLWKQSQPRELYSSHLSLRLALYYARTNQRDLVWPLLGRALEFLSVDYLLPEYVNTKTYGGSGGVGSSILAAADLVHLLRAMFLREERDHLVLLPGIPDDWYVGKKPLILNDLPTRFGLTDIEIGTSANQHQIEVGSATLPEEIEVHIPSSVPMRMIKAFGASIVERSIKAKSPHLRIVPLTDSAVLTFHK